MWGVSFGTIRTFRCLQAFQATVCVARAYRYEFMHVDASIYA